MTEGLYEQYRAAPRTRVEDPDSLAELDTGAVWVEPKHYADLGPPEDENGMLVRLGPYGEVKKVIFRGIRQ